MKPIKKEAVALTWKLARAAVDLFYPRQCQVCGAAEGCDSFAFLCDACFNAVEYNKPPWCEKCGLPFHGKLTSSFQCPNCRDTIPCFEKACSLLRFHGAVRRAIHGLKYDRQLHWFGPMQAWMKNGIESLLDRNCADVVTPVPLHSLRERERGFNQAGLLASALVREWKVPVAHRAMQRVRLTETQTHFDRQERLENLRDAFQVKRPEIVRKKRILLLDDVLTTGSTVNECTRVLREAGASSVLVFTLARG